MLIISICKDEQILEKFKKSWKNMAENSKSKRKAQFVDEGSKKEEEGGE